MSFSYEIKRTIMTTQYKSSCCRRALYQGVLASKGYTDENDTNTVYVNLENLEMIDFVGGLIKEFFNKEVSASSLPSGGRCKRLSFSGKSQAAFLASLHESKSLYQRKCPYCDPAFLKGVFLSCGRVTDPKKQFCLEFSLGNRVELFNDLLSSLGFEFKNTTRKNERLLYTKNSAVIEDFFAAAELNDVTYTFMNVKIENEFMNNANRLRNFDTVNISKAVDAANPQFVLIKKLIDNNLLGFLPEELQETAKMRFNNPDMSMNQLAIHSVPTISKSGITHRMSKIMKLGGELLSKYNL